MTRLSLAVVACVLVACQPFEFERVSPMAAAQTRQNTVVAYRSFKPNVMLLLDTSGSMMLPINPAATQCTPDCGTPGLPCPAGCPTRISEVKSSIDAFLQTSVTDARVGLTTFPADTMCAPPSTQRVELPPPTTDDVAQVPVLEARALQARGLVQAVQPMGGTPTAAALRYVGSLAALQDPADLRDDFVVLLTDGLPNCNDAHPANVCGGVPTPAQSQACACTLSSCASSLCSKGCLDDSAAVESVGALRERGIRTVVVGFGAETVTGDAPRVLSELAHAGGVERSCLPGACETPFYRATNATELAGALRQVLMVIRPPPCEFMLAAAPSSPELLSVSVDGVDVQPSADTWRYEGTSHRVLFSGAICQRLEASTALSPVALEFRIVEVL